MDSVYDYVSLVSNRKLATHALIIAILSLIVAAFTLGITLLKFIMGTQ